MHAEVLWLCRQLWLCSDPHKPIIWLKWIYKFLKSSWRSQNSRMQNEEFPHPGNPTSATSRQTHLNWLIARLDTKCTSFFLQTRVRVCKSVGRCGVFTEDQTRPSTCRGQRSSPRWPEEGRFIWVSVCCGCGGVWLGAEAGTLSEKLHLDKYQNKNPSSTAHCSAVNTCMCVCVCVYSRLQFITVITGCRVQGRLVSRGACSSATIGACERP